MSLLDRSRELSNEGQSNSLLDRARRLSGVEEGEAGALPVEVETRPSWRDSIGRALAQVSMADLENARVAQTENAPSEFLLHAGAGAVGWGAGKAAGLGNIGLGVLAGTMANNEQKAELFQRADADLWTQPDPELAYSQKLKGLTKSIDETVAEKVGTLGGLLQPPKTEGAQKALELAEKALSPIQKAGQWADEALTKAGFPTAGFVAGFATELALFKAAHVGTKRVGKFVKSMSLEEVNSLARQFESLSDQALKRQVEESLAKALTESNDPRFDKFKAEYENELQFRKQAVQARAEAMTEAGLEPPSDKFAVEAGLVEEQRKSVAQLLRETTASQKESHEQFISEHVRERDAVKKLADIRRKNLESQQRATDVTAIKEQIGIVPKLEPEITQRLRALQGESKPAVKPLEGETANDFIARMKAEGRIPEKAYRGEVKPEEVLESIPPEVSGLDDFVYMTREGKLVDDRGREVTFPEKAGEVEAAKPEAVPEIVEASKPVVEPVAEPATEPVVANSNQNLMEVAKANDATYNGVQEIPPELGGGSRLVFTDNVTKSTLMVKSIEELPQAVEAKRVEFEAARKSRDVEVVEPVLKREQLDLDRLPDWVEQNLEDYYRDAEEYGFLGKIQEAIEQGKTTKEIVESSTDVVEKIRQYLSVLYSEEGKPPKQIDIKDANAEFRKYVMAARLLDNGEIGDQFQTFRLWYNTQAKERQGKEFGLPGNVERVNPETGRTAGVAETAEARQTRELSKASSGLPLEQLEEIFDSRTFESRAAAQYWAIQRSRETGQRFTVEPNENLWSVKSPLYDERVSQLVDRVRGEVNTFIDLIDNERGSIDVKTTKEALDRMKEIFGKNPKAGRLLSLLKQSEIKKDDLNISRFDTAISTRYKPGERVDWEELVQGAEKGWLDLEKKVLNNEAFDKGVFGKAMAEAQKIVPKYEGQYLVPGVSRDYHEVLFKNNKLGFNEHHWGEHGENVMMHSRRSTMRLEDGSEALVAHDVQSVLHQRGLREGYEGLLSQDREIKLKDELSKVSENLHQTKRDFDYTRNDITNYVNNLPKEDRSIKVVESDGFEHRTRLDLLSEGNIPKGVTNKHPELISLFNKSEKLVDMINNYERRTAELENLLSSKGLPNAPYKEDWYKLLIRDQVNEATAKGLDTIGWTTGDFQFKMWGGHVGKQVTSLFDEKIPAFLKKEFGIEAVKRGVVNPEKVHPSYYRTGVNKPATTEIWTAKLPADAQRPLFGRTMLNLLTHVLKNERGSIDPQLVKTLMDEAKRQGKSVHSMLRGLGFSGEEIRKVTGVASETGIKAEKPVPSAFPQPSDKIFWQRPAKMRRGIKVENPIITQDLAEAVVGLKLPDPIHLSALNVHADLTAFRTPQVVFDKNPVLKERLLYPARAAMQAEGFELKALHNTATQLYREYSKNERTNVHWYAIGQQFGGPEVMKQLGIEPVKNLTPHETKLYETLRSGFEETLPRLNEVRTKTGKAPVRKVQNYYTWMRSTSDPYVKSGHALGLEDVAVLDKLSKSTPAGTAFRYEKSRLGRGPHSFEIDPIAVYTQYMETAVRHIHRTPVSALVSELFRMRKHPKTGGWYDFELRNRNLANFMRDWNNQLVGISHFNIDYPGAAKTLQKLSSNLTNSTLGGYFKTVLNQTTAFVNAYAELGEIYMPAGIVDNLSPAKRARAFKMSKHLSQRIMDVNVSDLYDVTFTGRLSGAKDVVSRASFLPTQVLDYEVALATWNGAYRQGLKRFGNDARKAANHADDVVVRTQGSAAATDRAPIQNNAAGKALTTFQTFTIANWNFLVNDVIGFKNAELGNATAFKRILRVMLATSLINSLFEDVIGVRSPLPTPIRSARRALEVSQQEQDSELGKAARVAAGVGREFLGQVPVVGNAEFGSSLLGPIGEMANNLSEAVAGKQPAANVAKTVMQYKGVPFTTQGFRTAEGVLKNRSLKETTLGPNPEGEYETGQSQERRGRGRERRSRERR